MSKRLLALFCFFTFCAYPQKAASQGKFTTEEHFHDLFITAGYATAFGAALGAAALGLTDNPSGNLRWVAMGASFGFIGGSLLGTYVLFAPTLSYGPLSAEVPLSQAAQLASSPPPAGPSLRLSPHWNLQSQSIEGWQASWVLSAF